MIDRQGAWGELEPGVLIRDRNGEVWRVTSVTFFGSQVTVELEAVAGGRKFAMPPRSAITRVTIVEPASDAEARGAILGLDPGAAAIAYRDKPHKVWKVLAFRDPAGHPSMIAAARSHMILMHGVWIGDVKTIQAAEEAHADAHAGLAIDLKDGTARDHIHLEA